MVTFTIFNQATGAPATGLGGGFLFLAYNQVNPPAANVALSPPAIVELGGGMYGFNPTMGLAGTGVAWTIQSPANTYPPAFSGYVPGPNLETFTIYQQATQSTPATGLAASFSFGTYEYVPPSGAPTAQPTPTIYELGGGQYGFYPAAIPPAGGGIAFVLSSPANTFPPAFSDYLGSVLTPVPTPVSPASQASAASSLAAAASSPFGVDILCLNDLDPMLTLTTGMATLTQDLANRLQTPRGGLFYDADYGTDLRSYLNGPMTPQRLSQLQADAQGECLKDVRVLTCQANGSFNFAASQLKLAITGTTAQGPFDFVLAVSAVTVQLLSYAQA